MKDERVAVKDLSESKYPMDLYHNMVYYSNQYLSSDYKSEKEEIRK